MAILGISTNTRLLATAIIDSGCLLDYSIHHHKQPWSPSKANQIINSLEPCVRRYCIKSIILSIPYEHYQTETIQYLFSRITRHFKKKGVTVSKKHTHTLTILCKTEQEKTKKAVMKAIAERFPELHRHYQKELQNKNKYYVKLFEAVGVAILADQKLGE